MQRLSREVVESPSLEASKNHRDVTLRDTVSGHGGDGLCWAWQSQRSSPTLMFLQFYELLLIQLILGFVLLMAGS